MQSLATLPAPNNTQTQQVVHAAPDAFFLSIYEGDVEAVLKALDDSPERLNKKLVGHNCNPFGLAARYGHTKLVEALLERDPDLIGEVPGPHRHSSKELTHHTV